MDSVIDAVKLELIDPPELGHIQGLKGDTIGSHTIRLCQEGTGESVDIRHGMEVLLLVKLSDITQVYVGPLPGLSPSRAWTVVSAGKETFSTIATLTSSFRDIVSMPGKESSLVLFFVQ